MYNTARPGIDRYEYGDGLLSLAAKIGKAVIRPLGNLVPKNTIFSKALQAVGLASSVAAPVAAGAIGYSAGSSASKALVPTLPGGVPTPSPAGGGILPFFRGPGGKLQMPWSDPKQLLQPPYAYDDSYLRLTYRAPRGYVVVKDPQGRRYAMLKQVARSIGLWRASRKPPISAGDWHRYQAARSVEKKLRKIASHAMRGRGTRRGPTGIYTEQRPIVHRKVA